MCVCVGGGVGGLGEVLEGIYFLFENFNNNS